MSTKRKLGVAIAIAAAVEVALILVMKFGWDQGPDTPGPAHFALLMNFPAFMLMGFLYEKGITNNLIIGWIVGFLLQMGLFAIPCFLAVWLFTKRSNSRT